MGLRAGTVFHGTVGQPSAQIIDGSLKFDGSSTYLRRTPGSASNRKTWTWSAWVKRDLFGDRHNVFGAQGGDNNGNCYIEFRSNDRFQLEEYNDSGLDFIRTLDQVTRDTGWAHWVVVYDSTQSTDNNKQKIYKNGVLQTDTNALTHPSLNEDSAINNNAEHRIGIFPKDGVADAHLDGRLSQVYLIDGQALTPDSFGFTDPLTNTWRPKKYTGTFGTNGFWLPMDGNSPIGQDKSGKGNNWTPVNFSGTSVDPDVLKDSPSGAVFGEPPTSGITTTSSPPSNYATLNPLVGLGDPNATFSDGNLTASFTSANNYAVATIGITTGKYYYELTASTNVSSSDTATYIRAFTADGVSETFYHWRANGGTSGLTGSPTLSTYASGDVLGVAIDATNSKVRFFKNGTLEGSGDYTYTTYSGKALFIAAFANPGNRTCHWNFGQKPFKYAPPDGFLSLNSASVRPETVIPRPDQFVGVAKYTSGDGSAVSVNSYNFAPDLIFIKDRDGNNNWSVFDTVSGYANRLDTTGAGGYQDWSDYFGSFDLNGFTIKSATSDLNRDTNGMCSWCWKAGGNKNTFNVDNVGYSTFTTAPGLNSGTIDLTAASVGTKQGFSIVKWTGTGSAGTVPHALDNVPRVIIGKKNGDENWQVYHHNSHATLSQRARLELNQRGKVATNDSYWNDTAPTSSVFSISNGYLNESGTSYIAYLWCDVPGLQKFGKYTGNATTNPFIELGFRPALLWIKNTSTTDTDWIIIDSQRQTSNLSTMTKMYINSSSSESTIGVDVQNNLDLLSNGFKLRDSNNRVNASNDVYIYFAWAEAPASNLFGGQSNAR